MFVIPSFFGLPLYFWIGLLLGTLVIIQVLIAKKWLPVPFVWHRRNGWAILFIGFFHGFLAFSAYVLHVKVQGF
jgi:hypothetical protein